MTAKVSAIDGLEETLARIVDVLVNRLPAEPAARDQIAAIVTELKLGMSSARQLDEHLDSHRDAGRRRTCTWQPR